MRVQVSKSAVFGALASSTVLLATWKVLQWRARKRAKETVDEVESLLREGPLVRNWHY